MLLSVSLLALGAAGAGPGSATTARASQTIVCPLEPAGHVVTCCGPPVQGAQPCCPPTATGTEIAQPICCPPNADCAAGLTIGSTPNPSTAGHQVTISGRLLSGGAGTPVALWQALPGGAFVQVAQTTTNSIGGYEFVRSGAETNRQWYVSASSLHSATIDQSVRAVVTLSKSLRVHVSPNHARERVWLQQREGAKWVVIARARLDGSSSAVITAAVSANQPVELRVVLPGDKRNLRSWSRTLHGLS